MASDTRPPCGGRLISAATLVSRIQLVVMPVFRLIPWFLFFLISCRVLCSAVSSRRLCLVLSILLFFSFLSRPQSFFSDSPAVFLYLRFRQCTVFIRSLPFFFPNYSLYLYSFFNLVGLEPFGLLLFLIACSEQITQPEKAFSHYVRITKI